MNYFALYKLYIYILLYVGHTGRVVILWVTPLGLKQQLDGLISWKEGVLFL